MGFLAVPAALEELVRPHIDSFDYFLSEGLERVVQELHPVEFEHSLTKKQYRVWFESPVVGRPVKDDAVGAADKRLFPRDCREAGTTYKAALHLDLVIAEEGAPPVRLQQRMGQLPIMVKSRACYLRNLSQPQLVARREEAVEMGGYFICNGIERIIRLLVQQRRHYIMALRRSAFRKRGSNYTDLGTLIRCVRPDETSATVRCHYLTDGSVNFAFAIRRSEYFVPVGVVLKCFVEVSDRELFGYLAASALQDAEGGGAFVAERAEQLLRAAAATGLRTRAQCLEHLGRHFRGTLDLPARLTDLQAGEALLERCIFVHLPRPAEKFALLLVMTAKLLALASGACGEDNPDALPHHEALLPGALLAKFTADQLASGLAAFREQVIRDLERAPESVNLRDEAYIKRAADRLPDIGRKVEYLLNTGNLGTGSGSNIDLSQASGFTIVAEKLNFFRYMSHFRCIHRGAYFQELRTTAVRKLLPDSWGFMCPVHTPDGSPCGLLLHLTATCRVATAPPGEADSVQAAIAMVAAGLGMVPGAPGTCAPPPWPAYIGVQLDGRCIGWVAAGRAAGLVAHLRAIKAARLAAEEGPLPGVQYADIPPMSPEALVPADLEVAHIPHERGGAYPGIFLFTSPARLLRPVAQLPRGGRELIGSLEQTYLSIRCPDGLPSAGCAARAFTHAETHPTAMLSVVASLTPFSDFNQSPRNMYQCQMGKQTMGTPALALQYRSDTKMYRLQSPQTPLVRTQRYSEYCMDEFPSGTNMIVAVLAYTGYDMEDAMILNAAAVQRGLAHGSLYKTETLDLSEDKGKQQVFAPEKARSPPPAERPRGAFGQRFPQNVPAMPSSAAVTGVTRIQPQAAHANADRVDVDGLPHVGAVAYPDQAYYSALDQVTGRYKKGKVKGEEVATVEQVALVGGGRQPGAQRANVLLRFNRNPVVGDKFSSRHGQKGVLSQLWPDIDMPFAPATGMRPDLIINPHAFPSRMTIGMLIESLVGKAGALQGRFVDGSPFQAAAGSTRNLTAEAGDALEAAGFHSLGGEAMVSGVTGEEFAADIYIGPVYYQRLRHMVSDKFQVRSTGPINQLTRQPVKGRKAGGGIRFGEMERDALLAHGAAYLLHDRLHMSSDHAVMDVCTTCGSLLTACAQPSTSTLSAGYHPGGGARGRLAMQCVQCGTGRHLQRVALPYVFRHLVTELAAMNIKCVLTVR
ncbi:hypothetical protein WJX81_002042 [Elliptochloris bilobata]|uniref:DNA-directed RNA polymerase subunit beta n=1 Tax=Elliptochloris bilobata TaxID=381761 RepID=A0AAW1SIH9_9CHLO